MSIASVQIGDLAMSRLIIGGNPFSGFSHQSAEKDREMRQYYTTARIKETLRQAEELGINTFLGRADHHIQRVLFEYWDEGGSIHWYAQTCPEYGSVDVNIREAIAAGASACYLHGGWMDFVFAQDRLDEVPGAIARIRDAGLPAGIAAHRPEVLAWAEENLELDFYMCSYYNPSPRGERPEGNRQAEHYGAEDRAAMVRAIQHLSKPAIHYKVLAAGRNDPQEAFAFVAQHLRPQDGVCVGVYSKHNPNMLREDLELLESSIAAA
jgi:hypothetical protein